MFLRGLIIELPQEKVLMKNSITASLSMTIVFSLLLLLSGCEVIGDIFGAGVYTGMFIVLFVIVLIVILVARVMRRK